MAITENTFTDAEFVAAVEANPALVAVIKTGLGSKKFVVQDETEHQTFLSNFKDTEYKNRVIGEHTSEFALKFEKDVLEQTGIPKLSQDEKYYDYYKRAMSAKLGSVKQMETELENLKKGGNPSEADKIRIKQLEDGIVEKENEWKTKYEGKEKELSDVKTSAVLNSAMALVRPRYKAGLPESIVKLAEQTIMSKLAPNIRVQTDGTATVVDEKGEVLIDKSTYKPKSIDAVIADELADMIDTGKKSKGTGTEKEDLNDDSKGEFKGVPADVKTKVQLTEYLNKLGILSGSAEFTKIFDEHSKNLPLR